MTTVDNTGQQDTEGNSANVERVDTRDQSKADRVAVRTSPDSNRPTPPRHRQRPRRRPWVWLITGLAVGAAGALAGSAWFDASDDAESESAAELTTVELATATVATQDLIEEIEWDGTLGYGDSMEIIGNGGTITSVIEIGTAVERGDTLLWIDQHPVTVFYGAVPAYRNLSIGATGADVQQLETNLVALGYDPDGTVTIDEDFTSYTAYMVERWQEDLGVEITGDVEDSQVVVVPGPSIVRSMADAGIAASGAVASLAPQATAVDVIEDGRYSSTEIQNLLSVSIVVDVSDADEFTNGDTVTIEQADESLLTGTVAEVGSEVTTTPDGGSSVNVAVEVDADSITAGQTELIEGAVVVKTVGSSVTDALVVPSRALISLKEGGFAVEKVTSTSTTELIGIEIGAFDDGLVEVVSVLQGTLTAGDEVVVPQ